MAVVVVDAAECVGGGSGHLDAATCCCVAGEPGTR